MEFPSNNSARYESKISEKQWQCELRREHINRMLEDFIKMLKYKVDF